MHKLHLGRAVPAAAMAVFLGVSSLAPCAAFADDAVVYGAHGSGGGSSITANQQSAESTTQDKDGHYTEKASAVMTANIDTIGGHWTDSGDAQHDNGKYVVTVPTSVGFTGVDVGAVDLTADYGVTVAGVIENGDTVTATVDYSQTPQYLMRGDAVALVGGWGPYSAGTDGGSLTNTLTQGKAEWSAAEVSKMNDSGQVVGTTGTESMKFEGTINSVSSIKNPVTYNFTTHYANTAARIAAAQQ